MKSTLTTILFLSTLVACIESPSELTASKIKKSDFITDSTNNCGTTSCQNLRKEFDYVVYVGKKIYCYWDLKKEATQNNYELIAKDLKSSINDQTTLYDYYLVLRKWAGTLQDGHVNAMWGSDNSGLEEMPVQIRLELVGAGSNNETLIVAKNSPATKQVPVGAIVTKVNGVEAIDRINEVEKYISGSTARMRRMQAARLIFSIMPTKKEQQSSVKIEYVVNGKTGIVDVPRTISLPINRKTTESSETNLDEIVQAQILPNNIGYLKIDVFMGGEHLYALLNKMMTLMSNTAGLIIDVRQNGGGDQSGDAIISHLISAPVSRYHQRMKISDLVLQQRTDMFIELEFNEGDEFTPYVSRDVAPASPLYTGKVFVLTSSRCFSACDTFVSALKENRLATIIGEPTAGGTGSPFVFDLNYSGLQFRYSVAQGVTGVNKVFIEGVGTTPDIEILPTVEERIKGEDQQLLKAINLVASQVGGGPLPPSELTELSVTKKNERNDFYSLRDEDQEIKKLQKLDRL